MLIIDMKNGIKLAKDMNGMGYAVFKKITYPSGDTAFWQQVSKWYAYKKYAVDIFNNLVEKEATIV